MSLLLYIAFPGVYIVAIPTTTGYFCRKITFYHTLSIQTGMSNEPSPFAWRIYSVTFLSISESLFILM